MPTPPNRPVQEVVDPQGDGHHVVDLLGRGPVERGDVLLRDHRVVELVVLQVELDDRPRQGLALGQAVAGGQGAGGDVAADHLQRDDLHFLDQLLAQVQPLDEVVLNPDRVQLGHDVFADAIVDDALALQDGLFRGVEGGGVVLEVLDQGARFRALIEDLGLALVDLLTAGHLVAFSMARTVRGRRNKKRARLDPRARVRLGLSPHSGELILANARPRRKLADDCRFPLQPRSAHDMGSPASRRLPQGPDDDF